MLLLILPLILGRIEESDAKFGLLGHTNIQTAIGNRVVGTNLESLLLDAEGPL